MTESALPVDDAQVRALVDAAERSFAENQLEEADRLVGLASSIAPDHPLVLGTRGAHALRRGNAAQAMPLLQRAVEKDPSNPRPYLNLASSLRALGNAEGEMKALETALTLDPYFTLALLQKASLLEQLGKTRESAGAYHAALSSIPPNSPVPASLQPVIERAQQAVRKQRDDLEALLNDRLRDLRRELGDQPQDRVNDCLAALLGRKKLYVQQPTFMHFPRVPAIEFYDRDQFPWLLQLESATESIREEALALADKARERFNPYVNHTPGAPLNQWRELNNSRRWSALFLYQDGHPVEQNRSACPETTNILEKMPLARVPQRAPAAFFSLLEPRTRIPPHTGVTNTRLIVHLPLVIPAGCGFRVGSDVREWKAGSAWVFDDTIEHEAWNDSGEDRIILIFDIWNPFMSEAERMLICKATDAITEYYAS